MKTKIIIFDFDGTIADTQDAVIAITNRLAPEFGFSPLEQKQVAHFRGLTAKEIIKQSGVAVWKLPFLMQRVKQELKQEMKTVKPIDGIELALEELKKNQLQLGIITSNSEENASQFLRQYGLLHYFNFVESSFYIFGKDKVIKRLLRQKNIDPKMVAYVGDETRDLEAARKSGVNGIAVTWGFNTAEVLVQSEPDAVIDHPSELLCVMNMTCKQRL